MDEHWVCPLIICILMGHTLLSLPHRVLGLKQPPIGPEYPIATLSYFLFILSYGTLH